MTTENWEKNKSFSLITLLGTTQVDNWALFNMSRLSMILICSSFMNFSPGSWFFLPLGTRIYNKLMEFIKKQYWDRGYQEVRNQLLIIFFE